MSSPFLLSAYEHCNRDGYWSRDWEKYKLNEHQFMQRCVRAGLATTEKDYGQYAGEEAIALGADPGLSTESLNVYDEVIHIAHISHLIVAALRKPNDKPWESAKDITLDNGMIWKSNAYLDPSGTKLRRVCLVTNWSDDRHYAEARSWYSLGEVCAYGLPMQQVVCVLGARREGKRHGYWSKGVLHPANKKLRFRKRNDVGTNFKDSWNTIFREDRDEITAEVWLQAMLDDGVLTDSLFSVDIQVPEARARQMIIDTAARRLEEIYNLKTTPAQQLSTCHWPTRCVFHSPCHKGESAPNGRYGFVPVEDLQASS
jgi:hypothetical protein